MIAGVDEGEWSGAVGHASQQPSIKTLASEGKSGVLVEISAWKTRIALMKLSSDTESLRTHTRRDWLFHRREALICLHGHVLPIRTPTFTYEPAFFWLLKAGGNDMDSLSTVETFPYLHRVSALKRK